MKSLTIIILGIGWLACNTPKKAASGVSRLNGTWIPVKQEIGGTAIPPASFEKQRLILNRSHYTLIAESIDKGRVKYNGNKIDIYGKEGANAGKHFTAIYKFEGAMLTVCYNLAGDAYPEGFDTKDKPMYFLSVFKKE